MRRCEPGLIGSDDYLEEWRRETRECGSDLEREVVEEASRLEAAFPPEGLRRLVRSEGRHQATDSNRA